MRRRLAVMSAIVVGLTVVLASVVCFTVMRTSLRGQVDDALRAQVASLTERSRFEAGFLHGRLPDRLPAPPARFGGGAQYVQVLGPSGDVLVTRAPVSSRIPVAQEDVGAATRGTGEVLRDADVDGHHVRLLTLALPTGGALQLGRSLESVDSALADLRWLLIALCIAGTGLAFGLGRLFAGAALGPVSRLSDAAGHIEATGDLARRVPDEGSDEVGVLARRFNRMLDRLHASQIAQRRLVADASHELRTPVTSLRTNAELLRDAELGEAERRAIAGDVVEQAEELTQLVADVIELARDDAPAGVQAQFEPVRLDELAAEAVERARRHAPGLTWELDAEAVVVDGVPDRLARAVNNLLDNAGRYAPAGSRVEVRVGGRELTVRDRGPGIDPAELPHVFDRFYRGAAARGSQGSGLGLAIVKQVAEAHGARVALEAPAGGGTLARLTF